jgi:hypothetical protein
MRLYMKLKQTNPTAVAAAKASISLATAYRIENDPRLTSQKKPLRGHRRPDPCGSAHAIVAAQLVVAARQVVPGLVVEIAEGGRQAVASVLERHSAQRPQVVLETFGEGDEALAAEHDMGVLEAGPGAPDVLAPMLERLAGAPTPHDIAHCRSSFAAPWRGTRQKRPLR